MPRAAHSVTILIPSFNDWESVGMLLARLDEVLLRAGVTASVLVVDDGSTDPLPPHWPRAEAFTALPSVDVLNLRSNVGHQRAIALGLYHLHEFTATGAVVVMDGDGEDRPEDVPSLLAAFEQSGASEVVFAARQKRMESVTFRFFYQIYRLLHLALTGVEVRVGNFSVLPRVPLTRLMAVPDLWNHYAAAVYRARLPRRLVPLSRGSRLAGKSKMNFVGLVVHGVSAMSVFSDQVSARLLVASAGLTIGAVGLIALTAGVRLFTDWAVPGWATYTIGTLLVLVLQSLTFALLFTFLVAHRRGAPGFIPLRDAPYYILSTTTLHSSQPNTGDHRSRSMSQVTDSPFEYVGGELALFEKARNWKAYWSGQIQQYLRGDILEVGAGIGSNTRLLAGLPFTRWTCLEPDQELLSQVGTLPGERHAFVAGTLADLPPEALFDAILYIDVLEHIEADRQELGRAARHLKPGGVVIVLSPAHQFLFTPFDKAIGHYRRYTRASLQAVAPAALTTVRLVYLDAVGMLASGANRLLLHSAMPTERQILTWDRLLVPISRCIDPLIGRTIGKTVLGVWQREAHANLPR